MLQLFARQAALSDEATNAEHDENVTFEIRNQMQTRMDAESLVYSVRVRSQVIRNSKYKNTMEESS